MPLIDPQPRVERDQVHLRLDRQTIARLRVYAEWLKSSQEWIVNRALEHLFARDREFQTYLRTRSSSTPTNASRPPRSTSEGADV